MRRNGWRVLVSMTAVLVFGPGMTIHAQATEPVTGGSSATGSATAVEADASRLSPGMAAAMARDLGLSETEAIQTLRQQTRASAEIAPRLKATLGDRFGGAWWDDATGKLAVGVRGAGADHLVRASGAQPVVVARSEQTLRQAVVALDATPAPEGVTSWYVDLPSNTVVVEALPQAQAAARTFVAAAGLDRSAVRILSSTSRPRPASDVLGGDRFNISGSYCSIGFPVNGGFVTAGHCVSPGAPVTSPIGEALGVAQAGVYPGADYGWVQTYSNWIPRPIVTGYQVGRFYVDSAIEMVVNSTVCRSGARTGWNCGRIQAKNVTVNYSSGGTIYNLTKTDACSEGGDSGGPFLSGTAAQGVLSGGDSNNGCPGHERSYFQPLQPILNAYGLTLTTTAAPPPAGSSPVMMNMWCGADQGFYSCDASYYGGVEPVTLQYTPDQYGRCPTSGYQYVHVMAVDAAGQSTSYSSAARGFDCPYYDGPIS